MTIATIPCSQRKAGPYTASAGQTVFPFAFPVYAATDIDVWREREGVATLLTLGVDYTVSGVNEQSGGSITLTPGALDGDIIAIDGDLLKERNSQYLGNLPLSAASLDGDLNRIAVMLQELAREVSRSVRRAAVDEHTGSLVLPQVTETTFLGLDATGKLIPLLPVNVGAVTPFIATLLDDLTPAAALSTLRAAAAVHDFNFQNYR